MAREHFYKCSPSLAIREMQIKLSLTSTSPCSAWPSSGTLTMANGGVDGEGGTLIPCWGHYKLVKSL